MFHILPFFILFSFTSNILYLVLYLSTVSVKYYSKVDGEKRVENEDVFSRSFLGLIIGICIRVSDIYVRKNVGRLQTA